MLLFLACAALLSAAASAQAPTWPGAQGGALAIQIEIPAGALPPGPALAEIAPGAGAQTEHAVRFEVPPGDAVTVRLWVPYEVFGPVADDKVDLVVVSDTGERWLTEVEPWSADRSTYTAGVPRFIGTADQLAELAEAMRAIGRQPEDLGLQLAAASSSLDCRELVGASFVVVDARGRGQELLTCAARGARVVMVDQAPPVALTYQAAGSVARWGRGLVAWAPAFDALAAAGVAALSVDSLRYEGWPDSIAAMPAQLEDEGSPLGVAGVLLLLGLYVVVIGPVGYLVGIRPRRPALAWGWFPAVSALATAGAAAVGLAWQPEPVVELGRTAVLSPQGVGLVHVQLRPDLPYGKGLSVTAPMVDADLGGAWPGRPFGSPFGRSVGALRIVEDRVAQRVEVSGLGSGSFGAPTLSWVDTVQLQPPLVRVEGAGYRVDNPGPRDVVAGAVLAAGEHGRFGAIPAGGSTTVQVGDVIDYDSSYDWIDGLAGQLLPMALPTSLMVAVEYSPQQDGLSVSPRVPLRVVDRVVVAGGRATLGGAP